MAGNKFRLIEMGMVPPLATEVANQINGTSGGVPRGIGGGYDMTADVAAYRTLPGYAGDDAPIINTLMADVTRNAFSYSGPLFTKTPILIPKPNVRWEANGGLQDSPIIRDPSHTGSTMIVGDVNDVDKGARACIIQAWFVHNGRSGWVDGTSLPNRLTAGQSHIEIHGAQNGEFRGGGFGCPHFMSVFGGAGLLVDHPFFFGGVWDPANVNAQEAISHIRATRSVAHGNGTNLFVDTPHMYGANFTGTRAITVGAKTVNVTQRAGPRFGLLIESCEDFEINGGFSAGYAEANVGILPVAGGFIQNGKLNGTTLDESNIAGVYTQRPTADLPYLDTLHIMGCIFNGQLIGRHAIWANNTTGLGSVKRLLVAGGTSRAHLAGAMLLTGVEGGRVRDFRAAGYNMAANDTTLGDPNIGAGIITDAVTKNFSVRDVEFGGGIYADEETNVIDPVTNLSNNACQWGLIDNTSLTKYSQLRANSLGLAGGGVVAGGVADGGL